MSLCDSRIQGGPRLSVVTLGQAEIPDTEHISLFFVTSLVRGSFMALHGGHRLPLSFVGRMSSVNLSERRGL